jgi:hypothetical protein
VISKFIIALATKALAEVSLDHRTQWITRTIRDVPWVCRREHWSS